MARQLGQPVVIENMFTARSSLTVIAEAEADVQRMTQLVRRIGKIE